MTLSSSGILFIDTDAPGGELLILTSCVPPWRVSVAHPPVDNKTPANTGKTNIPGAALFKVRVSIFPSEADRVHKKVAIFGGRMAIIGEFDHDRVLT